MLCLVCNRFTQQISCVVTVFLMDVVPETLVALYFFMSFSYVRIHNDDENLKELEN